MINEKILDWGKLRKDIPACEEFVFLNNAGRGPVSRKAYNGGRTYYDESLKYGNNLWDEWMERIAEIRANTADLIGGSSSEIAFLPNSSLGMNYAAQMLTGAGDVLMSSSEFPSCSLPWLQNGYRVDFIDTGIDARTTVDQFASAITPSTGIIVVSHVQYTSGFRQDLDKLGELCDSEGIHLVVDASQSAGAFDIDVQTSKIDFLVFTGYKWLNAGFGIAVLYINEKFHDPSRFPVVGWRSASDPYALINDQLVIADNAAALELGHPQCANIFALGGALETVKSIGIDNISERILHLSDYLHAKLREHDIEIISPQGSGERSGITSFAIPNADQVVRELAEKNVLVTKRGDGLRASLHYYNNHSDVDKFIEALFE